MSELFVFSLCLALLAVTWAVVLVDTGMLLEPVQRWFRDWYYNLQSRARYQQLAARKLAADNPLLAPIQQLDDQWWWKPLWGCFRCVSGQLALWGFPLRCYVLSVPYSPWHHLLCVCATIFLACILNRLYSWTQQI